MPDEIPESPPMGRATAGQLRRSGFAVTPDDTADDATVGFETVCHHVDDLSKAEHQAARARGDAFPAT